VSTKHAFAVVLLMLLFVPGCRRPTPEDRDNRRLLDAILTSITIKNARLLDDNEAWARERHEAGHLADEDFTAFTAIIAKARSRDWSGAETDAYAFRKKRPYVKDGH
jgi:hypothetical protein